MSNISYPKNIKSFLEHINSYGNIEALSIYKHGESLTYRELVDNITSVATNLREKWQLKQGDRVVLFGITGTEWVISYFACLLLGYIVVPIDGRMNDDLINNLVELTKPRLIISGKSGNTFKEFMSTRPTDLISKKTQNKSLKSFKSISSDSIAEIILTSGTWSRPKGVTLSHGNLLANLEGVDKAYHLKSNSRLLSILPLSHAYEQMIGLIIPLFRGASITYLSDITAKQLKEACLERKITLIVAVPRILEVLHKEIIRQIPASKRDTFEKFIILSNILPITLRRKLYNKVHSTLGKNLRTFVVGGAPLDEKLDKFFQGLGYEVFIGYGLSETSPVLSISLDQKRTRGNVGKPLSNIKVEINKDGEIRARGKSVFHGYWPNKRQGSFFNTGDLGNFDKKGNIVLNGRIKNLVVFPNGDKIFLEDIEKIAEGFDSIDESCALDIGDEQSPHLHLFVIAKKIDLEECRVYINQKLPFGISIKSLSLAELQSLPRTHTLKLMRRKILDYHKDHIKRIKSLSS